MSTHRPIGQPEVPLHSTIDVVTRTRHGYAPAAVGPLAFRLMGSTNLRTERLELRPVRDEDVDRILEYRNLPEVTRWLLSTEVDPVAFRAAWRPPVEDPDDHSAAVTLDGVVIG